LVLSWEAAVMMAAVFLNDSRDPPVMFASMPLSAAN